MQKPLLNINELISDKLSFDVPLLIAHLIAFAVIIFLLARFVYRPFRNWINQRAKAVADYHDVAQKKAVNITKLESQIQQQLQKTKILSKQMLSEAQKQARIKANNLLIEAQTTAKKQIIAGEQEAQAIRQAVQKQVQTEIVKTAVLLTQKLLAKELKLQDHKKLIDNFIKEIDAKPTK